MAGFPIVGIGSSAGGLEALRDLFSNVPTDSGLAFIVAAHLDPTRESHLSELLAQVTEMPVQEITGEVAVEVNHVYVIGPDQDLVLNGGLLVPQKPDKPRGHRYPVDSFFQSLAMDQGERAIAVVLSGTGTNGSQGLRFIKAEGGVAIAQLPDSAAFQGMPRSAIATGVVDLVLPPGQMAEALLNIARDTFHIQPDAEISETTPDAKLEDLLAVIRKASNLDFSSYKKPTLLRRIHRRMGLKRIKSLSDYTERLRGDRREAEALAGELTINVTGFFRDTAAWQELDEGIIAPLVKSRPNGSMIRAWVPGCSTGEEAYSLAMLLMARVEAERKPLTLQVFATDVRGSLLSTARAGLYPASIEADIGPERLARFFEAEDDSYRIHKSLRNTITFAPQNLLQDPPFCRMDLISCRNLLIYLKPEAQRNLLRLFHYALRENGTLFLGSAETVSKQDELFEPVSKKWRIYRRLGPTRLDLVEFPLVLTDDPGGAYEPDAQIRTPPSAIRAGEVVEQALLSRYAPASALVDQHLRVHYLRGPTGDYLQPATGDPSYNLIAMAREGLEIILRRTVKTAFETNAETIANGRVRRGDAWHRVRIVATPLRPQRQGNDRLLVSFFDREAEAETAPDVHHPEPRAPDSELQAELDRTREDLRLTLEQMEVSNEELTVSNEEIRSINEELRASNEELETSKEELQSLNEELHTVNSQLQAKVAELEARTDDLNNLLNSTDVATLFLDRDLCIRWFTPAMKSLLELRASDIGRPASHLAQKFRNGDMIADARGVLSTLQPANTEVVTDEERWYIRRIIPYRTSHDRIDGVVLTFIDITARKQWEQDIKAAREYAESIVDTVRDPLLVLTSDLVVRSANEPFYNDFRVSPDETVGRPIFELGNGQWNIPELRQQLDEVLPDDKQFRDFEVTHKFDQTGERTMLLNGRRLDHVDLILLAIEDVTERKNAELAVKKSHERLERVLETDAVGVVFFNADGSLVSANDVFLRMTGYTRAEIESNRVTWHMLVPDAWVAAGQEQLERLAATGRIGPHETEYLRKDGTRSWMLFAGRDLGDGTFVEFCIDISDRKQAEAERELLTKELSHRVKNTLAVAQALAMHTGGTQSVKEFQKAFIGRLQALGRAQSLLLDAHWRSADLKELVERATEAYRVDQSDVVAIEGTAVTLTPRQSLGLSFILHELGTNAAKYGALSRPGGRVHISWETIPDAGSAGKVRLIWQERGGPRVEKSNAAGFGTQLIEATCSYELDGSVKLDYRREGLTCDIVFPIDSSTHTSD